MDVSDATFETDVLARSEQAPVVVDLWASWCGPCKTLGPILEKVVAETEGRVLLAKVDVDANPQVAATFRVQSIPAVFALRDRKVVDRFVGALPEAAVRSFIQQLTPPPSEVEALIARGDEAALRRAVELEPANEVAVMALATLLVAAGATPEAGEEALKLLARLPETAEVRHVASLARVASTLGTEGLGDEASIQAKLDALLDKVKSDETARRDYVDLLEVLGSDDPLQAQYRKALTTRLF
jgi:putative thioredoxin